MSDQKARTRLALVDAGHNAENTITQAPVQIIFLAQLPWHREG